MECWLIAMSRLNELAINATRMCDYLSLLYILLLIALASASMQSSKIGQKASSYFFMWHETICYLSLNTRALNK